MAAGRELNAIAERDRARWAAVPRATSRRAASRSATLHTGPSGSRLVRRIRDAWRYVPCYEDLWRDVDRAIVRRESPSALAQIPIITKSDLLRYGLEERCDQRYVSRRHVAETSSGSTGRLLEYWMSPSDRFRRRYHFLTSLVSAGLRPGQRVLGFTDRHGSMARRLTGWHDLDITAGVDRGLERYAELRPHVLYGPMSTLLNLGEAVEQTGATALHRPDFVVSTGEQLSSRLRALLQARFRAPVVDFYGMVEFGLMAWRPASGHTFRTVRRSLHFEFVPSESEPELERLVVTDLAARLMPLIRYDTGDLVRRDPDAPGAPIVEVCGREIDTIRLPGGASLAPYVVTDTIDVIDGVEQFRVVQQRDLSLDVQLVLLADADDARVLRTVSDRLHERLGSDLPIRVSRAGPPLNEPGCKFRLVQSLARTAP